MPREKTIMVGVRIPESLNDALETICKERLLQKTDVLRDAIADYVEDWNARRVKSTNANQDSLQTKLLEPTIN